MLLSSNMRNKDDEHGDRLVANDQCQATDGGFILPPGYRHPHVIDPTDLFYPALRPFPSSHES